MWVGYLDLNLWIFVQMHHPCKWQPWWTKIVSPWIFRFCGVSPVFGDESGCGLEWCCILVLNCQLWIWVMMVMQPNMVSPQGHIYKCCACWLFVITFIFLQKSWEANNCWEHMVVVCWFVFPSSFPSLLLVLLSQSLVPKSSQSSQTSTILDNYLREEKRWWWSLQKQQ